MKSQLLSNLKSNALFYTAAVVLITIVFIDPFSSKITSYLETQVDSITLSLGILLELKAFASSSSSSHIPLISGVSKSSLDTLSSAIQYLSWSDILVTIQLTLITLSKSALIQAALVIALLGSFIPKYKSVALKVLVMVLLVNPGLPVYVGAVQYLAKESKLDTGGNLSDELTAIHGKYKEKELEHSNKEEQRKKSQLAAAVANGEDHISRFKQMEDRAVDDITKVGTKIEEGISEAYLVLKTACKAITVKTINLFTSILIQYILLPFLFFYGLFSLYQKFISGSATDAFLEKIIICESLFILIIGSITLI